MKLILVESPTKSRTLTRFLGKEYKVASSYGHIRDLPKGELGIEIENNFKPKYVIPLKARKTLKPLKQECQEAERVILGTDEDREGEAIAWHLTQALGLSELKTKNEKRKPYERIVFHEITKNAIEKALKNPRQLDMNLVNAQQARRLLDRLVGYKLSPFLWKKVFRGLSAGRVQSVAVRLVAEREREIEKFVPQEYWKIKAKLQKTQNAKLKTQNHSSKLKTDFAALLVKKEGKTIPKLGIRTEKEAAKIVKDLEGAEYRVSKIEQKEVKKNPLPPFITSTLQREAWQRFRWPAKMTMSIAQNLYERGRITYHRTDSLNLSQLSLNGAKKFIIEHYGQEYWPGFARRYKTKAKAAQEAHEAIRPTYAERTPEKVRAERKLEARQLKLYDLIWRRFIACQMASALFDAIKVDIAAKNYLFRATGQTLKFDGFLRVYPLKYEEAELPPLEKDELLKLLKLLSSRHFTKPPPRYTEATLIKALEEKGIGRPSTYAPILSTIQERNYVEKDEQKAFRPTEVGLIVNDLLVEHFPRVVDIDFTAKMEDKLDEVAGGKEEWTKVLAKFYQPFEKNLGIKYEEVEKKKVAPQEETDKTCPECGSGIIIRLGRFGKFYACSNFPKCKHTAPLEKKVLGIRCPKCRKGEITEKRTKKRKVFYGCNRFPDCDFALWDKPTGEKCQKCGALLIEKRGRVGCSNRECD